jgi:hypothetical protein
MLRIDAVSTVIHDRAERASKAKRSEVVNNLASYPSAHPTAIGCSPCNFETSLCEVHNPGQKQQLL